MDRTLAVRTPESIAFSYELAGLGSRFLALAVDFIVQIALLLALGYGFYFLAQSAPAGKNAFAPPGWAVNAVVAFFVFLAFMIFFGYFIVFEWAWNGQTPGKKALGIRVVRDGGYPIDFMASLVRNLIRVGEAAIGTYLVSAVVATLSQENKRIGDIAAGTIVVRDSRILSAEKVLAEIRDTPAYAPTAFATGEERAIVKRFLERRAALEPGSRRAIAHQLAERVRPRVPADMQRLDDEDLLERI
jgi:uncharacterized RDD family membrane protein YckC